MRRSKDTAITLAWGSGHPLYEWQVASPDGPRAAGSSSHRSFVAHLLRGPGHVRQARRLARAAFIQWGLANRAADAALAVSEIATNALIHGHQPALLLVHRRGPASAPIACCTVVNRGGWHSRDVVTDEGGRGLLIARQVADSMTVRTNKFRTAVTARFSVASVEQA
jgi:anti-sigma regulatory factor (Ser/Thr protein kinase)